MIKNYQGARSQLRKLDRCLSRYVSILWRGVMNNGSLDWVALTEDCADNLKI